MGANFWLPAADSTQTTALQPRLKVLEACKAAARQRQGSGSSHWYIKCRLMRQASQAEAGRSQLGGGNSAMGVRMHTTTSVWASLVVPLVVATCRFACPPTSPLVPVEARYTVSTVSGQVELEADTILPTCNNLRDDTKWSTLLCFYQCFLLSLAFVCGPRSMHFRGYSLHKGFYSTSVLSHEQAHMYSIPL